MLQAPMNSVVQKQPLALASRIANRLSEAQAVEAIVLSGSRTSGFEDDSSDIDLYVYTHEPISLETRAHVAAGASRAEIGNSFWEPGDEWIDSDTGLSVDVMFRDVHWIEDQLDRILKYHQASIGYSTCFWYNVLHSEPLFDRAGWFRELLKRAEQPYPAALRSAIIAKNHPLLRHNQSSYVHQMELAINRNDFVSLNHRCSALLTSYFDILFALNSVPHPGEKRLLQAATKLCATIPPKMPQQLVELLESLPAMNTSVITRVNILIDGLDEVLKVTV
jgi:predicted nucleotidyltransferase